MTDAPTADFFATLQSFRCTVTVDRGAIVLWHSACGKNLERPLPTGVGLGLLFAAARAHECVAAETDGFTCVHCGRVSHHPIDKIEGYCGACNHFCADVEATA